MMFFRSNPFGAPRLYLARRDGLVHSEVLSVFAYGWS